MTMPQSCRDAILKCYKRSGTRQIVPGTNAGLLMDRYLRVSANDDQNKVARIELQESMIHAVAHSNDIYETAFARYMAALPDSKKDGIYKTRGRLVIGLGGENVLETGLTLHRTYGTPLIPGTALKGLASHYCDQAWGAEDAGFKRNGDHHRTLFGTTEDSGHIIFHDAWMVPESVPESLQPDIMTPHHSGYYSGENAPTDYDDPVPITILSVIGSFYVAVSCDVPGDAGKRWEDLASQILSEALREWGIGGKTNSGYGRLEKSTNEPTAKIATSKTASSKEKAAAKVAEPNVLGPVHRKGEMVEVTREEDPNVRRGKPYFRADDGFGGFIQFGNVSSLQIGQKTRLEISGVMNEGYVFAVPGSKENYIRNKGKGGRR